MYEILLKKIERSNSIVIFGHRNPDGDSFGAAVALKEAIKASFNNKDVYIASSGLSNFHDLIGYPDDISDEIIENSLGIIVDCSPFYRVEDQRVKDCLDLICIDHHFDEDEDDVITIKDINYNSVCELLIDIFKQLDFIINKNCATALSLGILSDSGLCHFSKDFSKTFSSLAYLTDLGANISGVIEILSTQSLDILDFKSYLYSSYVTLPSGIIYALISKETLEKFNINSSDALSFVNSIGNVINYPIWIIFVEMEDGTMQVEFRGKNVDVHYLASLFGGGGHISASGCRLKSFSEKLINEVLYSCNNYLLDLSGDL